MFTKLFINTIYVVNYNTILNTSLVTVNYFVLQTYYCKYIHNRAVISSFYFHAFISHGMQNQYCRSKTIPQQLAALATIITIIVQFMTQFNYRNISSSHLATHMEIGNHNINNNNNSFYNTHGNSQSLRHFYFTILFLLILTRGSLWTNYHIFSAIRSIFQRTVID